MDLSLQPNGLITTWDNDLSTGMITVKFYDSGKTSLLGEIKIEAKRFSSLADMLKYIGLVYFPAADYAKLDGQRTVFDNSKLQGETKWV